MEDNSKIYRKAFSDIVKGYTSCFHNNKIVYIKHLTHHDQVEFDIIYNQYYNQALDYGVPKEEDILKYLREDDIWPESKDKKIEELRDRINHLIEHKEKHLYLPSQIEKQNKTIKETKEELNELLKTKREYMGSTAESHADKKVSDYYVIYSFYKDKNFKEQLVTEEELDTHQDNRIINSLILLYNEETSIFDDRNIKFVALQQFFQSYWGMCDDNLYHFFGRPVAEFTYFQLKLSSYAILFKNILSNSENIPEEVKKDPDKLIDYHRAGEKAEQKLSKNSKHRENVAASYVGATEEDLKNMGVSKKDTISLSDELKKKKESGKKATLNMNELMKMMNH